MASSLDYVQYVCDQMREAGEITYKKMFGEYTIYWNSKVLGLICDNQVFIKPTTAGETLIPNATKESPYSGVKSHIVLEGLDNIDLITKFVSATYKELPMPKPKKKKWGKLAIILSSLFYCGLTLTWDVFNYITNISTERVGVFRFLYGKI